MLCFGQLLGQRFKPGLQLLMVLEERVVFLSQVVHLVLELPGHVISLVMYLLLLLLTLCLFLFQLLNSCCQLRLQLTVVSAKLLKLTLQAARPG